MANTESVAALLKDPRKKIKKKDRGEVKQTGIANAIQRRIANGSYGRGKGMTSGTSRTPGTGFKAGATVGNALAQRTPVPGSNITTDRLAKLGHAGNRSAGYTAAIQKRLAGSKIKTNRRRPKRSFF
jgi:hypothetical protein